MDCLDRVHACSVVPKIFLYERHSVGRFPQHLQAFCIVPVRYQESPISASISFVRFRPKNERLFTTASFQLRLRKQLVEPRSGHTPFLLGYSIHLIRAV
jgi:hypothetical protein